MGFAAKLDDLGKPAWIVLVILCFMVWWPLGLATLAYAIGSRRIGRSVYGSAQRWYKDNVEEEVNNFSKRRRRSRARPSGNRAFDDYRDDTLRRLEEEQREFREFLDRLRVAKDKAEFDQFMAERRRRADDLGSNEVGPSTGA